MLDNKVALFLRRPTIIDINDGSINSFLLMSTSEKNPHDPNDEPTLHDAWENGAETAENGRGVGAIEDRYDDQDAIVAYLDGYRHVSANR